MAANLDNDVKVRSLQVGELSTPPDITAGTSVMSTTNRADGSIHLRVGTDVVPEVKVNGAVRKLGLGDNAIECRLANLVANQANTYVTYLPCNLVFTNVRRRYTTVPASAGGTVVASITLNGNQILASASENEEGLTNDTLAAHNLTGTGANLRGNKGDKVVITITSNNADMTGGTGGMYYLDYDHL